MRAMKIFSILSILILSGGLDRPLSAEEAAAPNPFESIQMGTAVHAEASVFFVSSSKILLRFYSDLDVDQVTEISSKDFGPISSVDVMANTSFEIEGFAINRFDSRNRYEVTEREGQIHLKRLSSEVKPEAMLIEERFRAARSSSDSLLKKLALSDDSASAAKNRRVLKALGFERSGQDFAKNQNSSAPVDKASQASSKSISAEKENLMNLMAEDIQTKEAQEPETAAVSKDPTSVAEAKVETTAQIAETAPLSSDMPKEFVTQTEGIQFEDDSEFTVPQFQLPTENF